MLLALRTPTIAGPAPRLRRWIAIASIAVLFYMLVIGLKPLTVRTSNIGASDGDSMRQIVYAAMFGALLLGSQIHRRPQRLFTLPVSMVLLLLWCAASVTWSAVPDIAFRRLLLTAMLIWSIFRIVGELGYGRTVAVLRIATVVALVLNYVAIGISPVAIHQFGERMDVALTGNWRGFLGHKNWTGALCAMTLLLFVFGGRHWRWPARIVVILATAFFLYKTQSKTSINIVCVSLVAGWAFLRYNPAYRALLIPLLLVAAAAAGLAADAYLDDVLQVMSGADPTVLTGRVLIWPVVLAYSRDHLLFGTGFGSFWFVGADGPIYRYSDSWVSDLANAHNGYLDLLATLGVPGLILGVLALLLVPLFRLLASRRVSRQAGALLVAMILFCAGNNVTESTYMDRDMLLQIFAMFAVALTAHATRRRRRLRRRELNRLLTRFGRQARSPDPLIDAR